ncbi:HD domain-containing protein [Paenibacillus sophorae]|uniref:HD domain-containing protein n=1 Tax=Paenibacillus sophorae TaxID=1333845 RepID=A0A1H8IT91_9BACL|nr:HD domain-containing phosphohydrolase [Paenibacillus sophorae]QWU16060.1 HD domain-containing protein [Paenibacillus sophorae]SEN71365.1 HD domain-containing protein [Paenibacillus sophorae]
MKGLNLGSEGHSIAQEHEGSSNYFLLAKGDGSEVILQTIQQDKLFYVYPGEEADTMEFFYILEGQCSYKGDNENIVLGQGDYFYTHYLQEAVYFSTLTELKLLWHTTKPAFHLISHRIRKLENIIKRVEEKDNYTFKHSGRVQKYCLMIARMIKIPKDNLEDLYFAAAFHDIGKIHTPEEILNKTGRLTEEEFEIVKRHCYDGYVMVKDLYYNNICLIILQHHERLDGSGYPYGIKEEEILLEAKIIGIADTFDAMTSDRPYRKGLPPEIAMDELKRLSGIHYDGGLVQLFEQALIADGILKPEEKGLS